MAAAIVPIVEGIGERESVPILLRRFLNDLKLYNVSVTRPFRVKRNKVVKEGEMERAVQLAVKDRENARFVLVLLDADDDCPAELGPSLLQRCRAATSLPVAVVLAKMELEAWFLGAKESLRGIRGIRANAHAPLDPEEVRGAKELLTKNMEGRRRYLEVDDQPTFAEMMNFEMARQRCPSFRKFLRDVENLVKQR